MTKAHTQARRNWMAQIALIAALAALTAGAQALAPSAVSAFQTECMDWTDCGYVDQGDPDGTGWDTSGTPADGYGMPSDDDWEDGSAEDPSTVADGSDVTADDRGSKQEDGSSAEGPRADSSEERGSAPGAKDPSDSVPRDGVLKPSLENSLADSDDALPVCKVWGLDGPCRPRNELHNHPDAFKSYWDNGWTGDEYQDVLAECRAIQEHAWDILAVSYLSSDFGIAVPDLDGAIQGVRQDWWSYFCDLVYGEPSSPKPSKSPHKPKRDRPGVA